MIADAIRLSSTCSSLYLICMAHLRVLIEEIGPKEFIRFRDAWDLAESQAMLELAKERAELGSNGASSASIGIPKLRRSLPYVNHLVASSYPVQTVS